MSNPTAPLPAVNPELTAALDSAIALAEAERIRLPDCEYVGQLLRKLTRVREHVDDANRELKYRAEAAARKAPRT